MTVNLRPYTETDLGELLQLIKTAFKEHEGVVDPPPSAKGKTLAILRDELTRFQAVLAEVDGRLIGSVFFKLKGKQLYMGRLAVLPELRGRGVARNLLEAVEDEARRQGCEAVILNVRVALARQQAIYRHWGFEAYGYGSHEGFATATFIRMRKLL